MQIARDVTSLKEAEEQLYNLRSELALVSRQTMIGTMTASIAHEIRQPLASIAANASAGLRWLNKPDISEAQAALTRVIQETHRVDEVIASIRTMFGRKAGQKTKVNIRSLVSDVIVLTQRELTAHRITYRNVLQDNLPDVEADRVQLQQVLVNLVMNAIEAMSEIQGRDRKLTIGSTVDEREIVLTIADNGQGLDPERHRRIFDPFFTTKSNGMGLGLSICRSIVEGLGGRIWASASHPSGATFHVALPVLGR
jgi:C4-dicarboxylate-specific signal transduction histidine kinase